jgi:hypothetical protein
MPFNTPLTGQQRAIVAGKGYSGRDYIYFCPQTVVFQARPVAASSADVIAQLGYTGVLSGSYTAIQTGMTLLITAGTSLKRPLWRGRIRRPATASLLYINEASIALDPSYYVTVIDTRDPVEKLRSGDRVDWEVTYQHLPPLIKDLSSVYFRVPDHSGQAQLTLSPGGQALAEGATITGWLWAIPGATYLAGSPATRTITVTVPEGHRWARVTLTDSNGVSNYFDFEIIVADETSSHLVAVGHEGVTIDGSWENGWSASFTCFHGYSAILDRTRCVIVSFEQYREGDPAFPQVKFVGYLRHDDNETRGDAEYSILKERRFRAAGFAALMGDIKLSQLAIRDRAVPAAWDEMRLPNPARIIAHLLTRYSTLAHLCAVDLGPLNNDWYSGETDVEDGHLLEACNAVAGEINAALIFAPCGQIILRRHASFLSAVERDALEVIVAGITSADLTVISRTHPHLPALAQIKVGCRSYRTADGTSFGVVCTAPAVAFAEGADFDEVPAQLLRANATAAAAKLEAGQRTANLLAYRDEGDEITVEFDDGWSWLVPSQHQWWSLDVAADEMTDGIAITPADRLLLAAVTHTSNPERGTRSVRAVFRRETFGGLAQVLVEIAPSVVETVLPVQPPLPAYLGAFAPSPTLLYTSRQPPRPQPYRGRGLVGTTTPYAPAQQDEIAAAVPDVRCYLLKPAVNFRSSGLCVTPFQTQQFRPYNIFIKGSAKIAAAAGTVTYNYGRQPSGLTITVGSLDNTGFISSGTLNSPGYGLVSWIICDFVIPVINLTLVRLVYDSAAVEGAEVYGSSFFNSSFAGPVPVGGGLYALDVPFSGVSGNMTIINTRVPTGPPGGGGNISPFRLVRMEVTHDAGTDLYGDAFYQWVLDGRAELYPAGRGLRLDGVPVAVPPEYDPNHEYVVRYQGTGLQVSFQFADTDYSDNENRLLYVMICEG